MLHFYDRATIARALTLDLDPKLHALLTERINALGDELIDWTECLVVQPGDTEDDIIRHVGFSPLVEPIDGIRSGEAGFTPFWDYLADHGGYFELIVTFGSTFAYIVFVQDTEGVPTDLLDLCRIYART
ncbi:MAG: hypothetical protein V4459_01245 [Pseudomonadota bacterium]